MASDGEEDDRFGKYVFILNDFAIVGSSRDDGSDYNCGFAYILKFNGEEWNEYQKISASDF
ncbi:MAG: FG-GAP repeat protein [Bacteroidales bacterium]|nr:FG-GAP repeat protein [Bacteroidales bacterium]